MERRTLLKIGAAGLIATAALPMPRVFAQNQRAGNQNHREQTQYDAAKQFRARGK